VHRCSSRPCSVTCCLTLPTLGLGVMTRLRSWHGTGTCCLLHPAKSDQVLKPCVLKHSAPCDELPLRCLKLPRQVVWHRAAGAGLWLPCLSSHLRLQS
jgi:hypothetical protein